MSTLETARLRRRALLVSPVLALAAIVLVVPDGSAGAKAQPEGGVLPTIVLVHGDWADASSWTSVLERLRDKGYTVVALPNPLRGPAEDASHLSSYLSTISGPIVLVAHSYGGFVITNAATGNPNVEALVYIDSFMPDQGETLGFLAENGDSCVTQDALNPVPYDGGVDLYLRWDANGDYPGFTHCFANGVDLRQPLCLPPSNGPPPQPSSASPPGPRLGRRSPPGR